MGHNHAHHHHHHHGSARDSDRRRLTLALVLAAGYMLAEVIGGWWSNSLALLADAGHMFSDSAALGLSLFAVWIADRPSPPQRTYGYYRAEILAALANGAALVAISINIFIEAFHRFRDPPEVAAPLMLAVAAGGLVVNLLGLWILHGSESGSLNMRGALLHVMGDTLGSVGTIVAGGLIWGLGWRWADPAASIVIGLLIVYSSWQLLRESVSVLMENAPRGIDVDAVFSAMRETPGVAGVHDLHVWTITSGLNALSAHVVIEDGQPHTQLLQSLQKALHDEFGIDHITIQIEPGDYGHCEPPV